MSVLLDGYERTLISVKDGYVLVDTRYTFDHGWETMAFPCNENGDDWQDEIDAARYRTKEEAQKGHDQIVDKWQAKRKKPRWYSSAKDTPDKNFEKE